MKYKIMCESPVFPKCVCKLKNKKTQKQQKNKKSGTQK